MDDSVERRHVAIQQVSVAAARAPQARTSAAASFNKNAGHSCRTLAMFTGKWRPTFGALHPGLPKQASCSAYSSDE